MQKQRNVKITQEGKTIYSETLPGANKSKKVQYIQELIDKADELLSDNVSCELHYQQANAKGWSTWYYCVGDKTAYSGPPKS